MKTDVVVQDIDRWIDALVVGLNLCPFANSVRRKGLVKIEVCPLASIEDCLQMLVEEANQLELAEEDATTLLVLPHGFAAFDEYLDLLALADQAMFSVKERGKDLVCGIFYDTKVDGKLIKKIISYNCKK